MSESILKAQRLETSVMHMWESQTRVPLPLPVERASRIMLRTGRVTQAAALGGDRENGDRSMEMDAILLFAEGDNQRSTPALPRGGLSLPGRSGNPLVSQPDDKTMADRYQLTFRQGSWWAVDESRSGTFVDDVRISAPCRLHNGALIRCGTARVRVQLLSGSATPSGLSVAALQQELESVRIHAQEQKESLREAQQWQRNGRRLAEELEAERRVTSELREACQTAERKLTHERELHSALLLRLQQSSEKLEQEAHRAVSERRTAQSDCEQVRGELDRMRRRYNEEVTNANSLREIYTKANDACEKLRLENQDRHNQLIAHQATLNTCQKELQALRMQERALKINLQHSEYLLAARERELAEARAEANKILFSSTEGQGAARSRQSAPLQDATEPLRRLEALLAALPDESRCPQRSAAALGEVRAAVAQLVDIIRAPLSGQLASMLPACRRLQSRWLEAKAAIATASVQFTRYRTTAPADAVPLIEQSLASAMSAAESGDELTQTVCTTLSQFSGVAAVPPAIEQ